ncbi:phosphomannomutase [Corynebacterium atypicum]|uniref:Phosphomannomutase n=1 Tax=Corynebacterium atypicum TaxID=191610 RepID=A0ABN4DBP2_9CORY|nr:phosphomannomutase/phosphoglucomutase [Corynebacterium atypicum]AIG63776.1 phosphomannomutase [Corynebacterium atypicum]
MRTHEHIAKVVKAYDVRGVVGEDIDEALVFDVAQSFARQLREEAETTIAVGHDMRPSSPALAAAFARGAQAQGINVIELGLTATDELYFAAGSFGCAGAMFTASHNPARYNGIKLCRRGARPVSQDTGLATIAKDLVAGVPAYSGAPGKAEQRDVLDDYASFLRGLVDVTSSRPLRIAVDAGNGMAGLTVPAVLDQENFDIRELYFELDGTFPNHEANPLDLKNLVDLQRFVVAEGADIGLAFDGDADRCFVVDELGNPVSPSAICGIIAENYLAEHPGATIIHNLITSQAVPEIIQENGGTPVRTRVGHSYIKATMASTGAVFGGEHSAHYYFTEFFNADSGLLAALHVLQALGGQDQPLSQLISRFERYVASGEINSTVSDQAAATGKVHDAFADRAADIDLLDGLTVRLKNSKSWFNVRPSNTEPLLRLNVEAASQAEVDELAEEVLGIIRG